MVFKIELEDIMKNTFPRTKKIFNVCGTHFDFRFVVVLLKNITESKVALSNEKSIKTYPRNFM